MSAVVDVMLGDMYVKHLPIVSHNSEENGLFERFNGTIMNAGRAAFNTSEMSWQ